MRWCGPRIDSSTDCSPLQTVERVHGQSRVKLPPSLLDCNSYRTSVVGRVAVGGCNQKRGLRALFIHQFEPQGLHRREGSDKFRVQAMLDQRVFLLFLFLA